MAALIPPGSVPYRQQCLRHPRPERIVAGAGVVRCRRSSVDVVLAPQKARYDDSTREEIALELSTSTGRLTASEQQKHLRLVAELDPGRVCGMHSRKTDHGD